MNKLNNTPKCGDIFSVDFRGEDCVQRGLRPALILQNNVGNRFSPNVMVLPLTSKVKRMDQPTHVIVEAEENGLIKDSIVLCENITCIPKKKLGKYITSLDNEKMRQISEAVMVALGILGFAGIANFLSAFNKSRVIESKLLKE